MKKSKRERVELAIEMLESLLKLPRTKMATIKTLRKARSRMSTTIRDVADRTPKRTTR